MKTETYMMSADGNIFATYRPEFHKDCTRLTKTEGKRLYRAQVIAQLKRWIQPGTRIYTKLEHVSSSGMSRRISLCAVRPADSAGPARIADITYQVAVLRDCIVSPKGGISISGYGMDMGFSMVYDLGRSLWPDGTEKAHGTRNGEPDFSGGYALKHEWL